MSQATVALSGAALSSPSTGRTARLIEFLLVGGSSFVVVPIAMVYRALVGAEHAEYEISFLAFYAAYVINDPHFAVTYFLFYRDVRGRAFGKAFAPVQRVRYLAAGFIVPLMLIGWGAIALHLRSPGTLGAMIQLMFLLVGWHYVKQGFGVLMVLSGRRGVSFTPVERFVILAHCFLGWAFAWSSPADPGTSVVESGVVHTSILRPPVLGSISEVLFWASAVALAGVLVQKWRRERRPPPLVPLSGLLVSVWLWTVFIDLDPLMIYVIPALHSIQYLYFVWLLRRNEAREFQGPPHFSGTVGQRVGLLAVSALVLGWVLFRGGPPLLDGTTALEAQGLPETVDPLGPTPYLAVIVTFVNLHHYFMDHVIWRRENPETRFLRA